MNDDQHQGAILEVINDQLKAILEGQAAMATVPKDIQEIKERLGNVEADVRIIKAAVTDVSKTVNDHEHRLAQLE